MCKTHSKHCDELKINSGILQNLFTQIGEVCRALRALSWNVLRKTENVRALDGSSQNAWKQWPWNYSYKAIQVRFLFLLSFEFKIPAPKCFIKFPVLEPVLFDSVPVPGSNKHLNLCSWVINIIIRYYTT